jgi:VIT1/CCC1 family predicted Fe2+/Mn2+ transporter
MSIDDSLRGRLIDAQRDEITANLFYSKLASRTRDLQNRSILESISKEERGHYGILKKYTGREVPPKRLRLIWYSFVSFVFGITFAIKIMEGSEVKAQHGYEKIADEIPELQWIVEEEGIHENALLNMIDERRLSYTGAVIRGLNDGIVEITGEVAGLTFVFEDTTLIGVIAIITGIVGSLSLASSEFLAARWEGGEQTPLGSAAYTLIAFLITVGFLIFPYLMFSDPFISLSLVIINAIILILILNYNLAVAKDIRFRRRASEMLTISLVIAGLTFILGYLIREFLHIGM